MAASWGIPVSELVPEPTNRPPMPREARIAMIARALETTSEVVRAMDENDPELELMMKRAEQASLKQRSEIKDVRKPGSVSI